MEWEGRITLVNPAYAVASANYLTPQLGLHILAGALGSLPGQSRDIQIVDQALELAEGVLAAGRTIPLDAARLLSDLRADIYAFSVQCFNLPVAVATARHLKEAQPGSTIVFGGHHARLLGQRLRDAFPFIDHVTDGPAESEILGASARNSILEPSFDVGPSIERYRDVSRQFSGLIEISRGCPYGCTFCSIPNAFGHHLEHKPVDRVVHEYRNWVSIGIVDIHLVDDVLTLDRRYLDELLTGLSEFSGVSEWTAMTRVDLVDPPLLHRMRASGCRGILYGVESGDLETLNQIAKRTKRYPDLIQLARWHVEAGIQPTFYFVVNFPYETIESIEKTLCIASQMSVVDPGSCRVNLPRYVAGTALCEAHMGRRVLNVTSPYADTLRATVGDDCDEVWELIKSYPEVFTTYYSVPAALDLETAHTVSRWASALLTRYPLSMAALAGRQALVSFFREVTLLNGGRETEGSEVFEHLCLCLERENPDYGDIFRFEQWHTMGNGNDECGSFLVSRLDERKARLLGAEAPRAMSSAILGEARLYRVSAISRTG